MFVCCASVGACCDFSLLECECGLSGFFFSDSNCEFVEPQIFSLSRTREASVARECETDMNIEGPLVKAMPESVRRRPTPQSSPFKAAPQGV